ncbi:hypothetical protein ES332_A02G105000v1 [Gossypium tomentosum]|uniref:Uncharacterized protein n=1 Tax=Gossypium tomentosum TaxID=34277 RepID=A0A5D2RFE8_GOSTO|nr:hypothetical protein ES332_A02G105000v1 [Gossypium tomentosum]
MVGCNGYAITCLLPPYSAAPHKPTLGSIEYPITGVFHSGLKQRFLGISIPFPHHRLSNHYLRNPILPYQNFTSKTLSIDSHFTFQLRHSSPSSKVRRGAQVRIMHFKPVQFTFLFSSVSNCSVHNIVSLQLG